MEMQDKEFDHLFNAKLNDFEVEPSSQVWQNINRELDGKKTNRSIMPYLSIAASVIILASVSLLFYNRSKEKADPPAVKLVKDIKQIKERSTPATSEAPVPVNVEQNDTPLIEATFARVSEKVRLKEHKNKLAEQPSQQTIAVAENTVQKPEPLLAVVTTDIKTPQLIVPANDVLISTGQLADVGVESFEEQPGSVVNTPVMEKAPAKKRARGLGGLINTVIAAVDKREDKLIEFTDASNDEGSRLTGLNLGVFKIKKQ